MMNPELDPTRATASLPTSGFSISVANEATASDATDPALALTDRKDHQGERLGGDSFSSDDDKCEGCGKPAKHYDSEGVPLCEACYDACLDEQIRNEITEDEK
jgi:hypothetical protein